MSIVSFEDWKQKKQKASAFNSRGGLREDIALKEEYGYDLCVFIAEERSAPEPNSSQLDQLWQDLRALMASLPHEHAYHYFKAFEAFCAEDETAFLQSFDRYLESEKQLEPKLANCDWWIDCFVWVFTPAFPGMYGRVAELFFKHWPLCSMGWVCEALEQSEADEENLELELDLLMLALTDDPKCYLAHYLIATIYYDLRLWRSALPYFEKAAGSTMYSQDAAFYFDYAWAADKAGKYSLAVDLYNSCLLLDETYPCAVNNLGCVYLHMNKDEEALSQFTRAIRLGLDGGLPYRNTVSALEKLGRYDEAIQFISQNVQSGRLSHRYEVELPRLRTLRDSAAPGQMIDQPSASGKDSRTDQPMFEKHTIADELERRLERGENLFGRALRVYEDDRGYGREYYLPGAGRIDLLCCDDSGLCVIAIAAGEADERTLLRLLRQISAVRKTLPKRWSKVSGIIVGHGVNPSIHLLHTALRTEDIRIYDLGFSLTEIK